MLAWQKLAVASVAVVVVSAGGPGAAVAQPAKGLMNPLKLKAETVIEFKAGVTPKRPIGAYCYTFAVPNPEPGKKLRFDLATVGGVPVDCQVAILDPAKRKGEVHNWGVRYLSPKSAGGLKWTADGGMPQDQIVVQIQCYAEGKVKAFIDWE